MSGEAQRAAAETRGWARGFLWSERSGLIPLVAGLLLVAFLLPQFGSGKWKFKEGDKGGLQFGALLTTLPGNVEGRLKTVLGEKVNDEAAEGVKRSLNYTAEDLAASVSAPGVAAWRFTTGLSLVVIIVGLVIATLVIWHAPSGVPGGVLGLDSLRILAAVVLTLYLLLFYVAGGLIWPTTTMTRQFLGSIQFHLSGPAPNYHGCDTFSALGCSALVDWELYVTLVGYVLGTYLLCASAALLRPARCATAAEEAGHVARQMRHLRLLLYAGSVVLAVTALRARLNFGWALDYLPPLSLLVKDSNEFLAATILYPRLQSLVTNNVTAVALLNTIALAAIYVPAAVVLQKRAEDVTDAVLGEKGAGAAGDGAGEAAKSGAILSPASPPAAEKRKAPAREEWMKAHGLAFPLKEHLGRVAAILSPLLAGPVAELLLLLKG